MPFNSFLFLFVFLPGTLVCYYLVANSRARRFRNLVIIAATVLFYAGAAARFLPLLLVSIAANYLLAYLISRAASRRRLLLAVAIVANLAALFYFKYTAFAVENLDALAGLGVPVPHLALPLGISFYTFQQIAFLIDASRGTVRTDRPTSYFSSILFFPIIISGPITLYRELAPQLEHEPEKGAAWGNILIGTVIFALGLFKKTVIADTFVLWVDPLFATATNNGHLGLAEAWGAAIGYLLQMYFDFSGYSDMALGIARMFGILLPLNFFSPIRSTSIIEWWRRWHMTLGRWVNAYIFQPLALPLARWSAMRGLGRKASLAVGTLLPTFLTMLIIGVWHGGNWNFFIFGALHGSYMVIAETWRFARRKQRKGKTPGIAQRATGNILTLLAVFVAVVPFRAPDVATTLRVWSGMIGRNGWAAGMTAWPLGEPLCSYGLLGLVLAGLAFAYLLPNTEQVVGRYTPALEWATWQKLPQPFIRIVWRPTFAWSIVIGIILMVGAAFVARGSTSFVYFGF